MVAGSAQDEAWAALRADLSQSTASAVLAYVRDVQIRERSFFMQRDIDQAGVSATMCERLSEMNDLVERNNAEAGSAPD